MSGNGEPQQNLLQGCVYEVGGVELYVLEVVSKILAICIHHDLAKLFHETSDVEPELLKEGLLCLLVGDNGVIVQVPPEKLAGIIRNKSENPYLRTLAEQWWGVNIEEEAQLDELMATALDQEEDDAGEVRSGEVGAGEEGEGGEVS